MELEHLDMSEVTENVREELSDKFEVSGETAEIEEKLFGDDISEEMFAHERNGLMDESEPKKETSALPEDVYDNMFEEDYPEGTSKELLEDTADLPENEEYTADEVYEDIFQEDNEGRKFEERSLDEIEDVEDNLEQIVEEYFEDLKSKSEYPETISDKPFEVSDLKRITPVENAKMHDEYDDLKADLRKQWEEINGMPWPKYENDVYSANGNLIRKAGDNYDLHHVQPLGMGGKNEVGNITPLHAEVHYDKQGIHAPDSPYSKIDKELGETE